MKRFLYLWHLALLSAFNRRGTLSLVVLSVVLSTMLLLGIEKVRSQVKENFVQALSGTDLIIGPRGSDINLILFSIFHLGSQPTNMSFDSAKQLAKRDDVEWVIPISLGDSHHGYPVVSTDSAFYEHYSYRLHEHLQFAKGHKPQEIFDVVLGAEVAKKLGYNIGQTIHLTHGMGEHHNVHSSAAEREHHHGQSLDVESELEHSDFDFTVTGILKPTATPVDRSIFINLTAMKAIHIPWQSGVHDHNIKITPEQLKTIDLEPESLTALLLKLKSKTALLTFKRQIDELKSEPLMAVIPAIAMDKVWSFVNSGERVLVLISIFVTTAGLASLAAVILAGLGERRRELAILRSVGARPFDILALLFCEGFLLILTGVMLGLLLLYSLIAIFAPTIVNQYGIFIQLTLPSIKEWHIILGICLAGVLTSLIPGYKAYKLSLNDGLNVSV